VGDIPHRIAGICSPEGLDEAIGDLAARQWGVVAARQLRALGIGRGAIEVRMTWSERRRARCGAG
jgi:hypothetical protein